MSVLERRAIGALAGAAVGDALGGSTEGRSPEQIIQRWGGPVTGIVGPFADDWRTARPHAPYHKGDGHVTDDTLMTNMLVKVYAHKRDHLGAYDVDELLVPLLINERVWIPELETESVALQRIFLAEKWLVSRLFYGHVDPREAGVGNIVNCGAAMYMAPVGIVNAGDPGGAYAEAVEIAGALGGAAAVPAEWSEAISAASRTDLVQPARVLAEVATEVFGRDRDRFARRAERFGGLA